MRWLRIWNDENYTVQTMPMTDEIIHVLDDCICGPTGGTCVGDGIMVYSETVHHPLIGREKST